jgi:hypothetical protein
MSYSGPIHVHARRAPGRPDSMVITAQRVWLSGGKTHSVELCSLTVLQAPTSRDGVEGLQAVLGYLQRALTT